MTRRERRVPRCGLIVVAAVMAFGLIPLQAAAQRAGGENGAATPRTSDGKPDLTGYWAVPVDFPTEVDEKGNIVTLFPGRDGDVLTSERDQQVLPRSNPNRPIYKPEFWAKVQALEDDGAKNDPGFVCLPNGVPRMGPPSQIVQTPTMLVMLYAQKTTFRLVPLDGRPRTPKEEWLGTFHGQARGRWEGDTLVIETEDFNDTSWLAGYGYFHSKDMEVTERLRREGNMLHYEATVEDPVLLKPWVMDPRTVRLNADPKAMVEEDLPCIERDYDILVTKER